VQNHRNQKENPNSPERRAQTFKQMSVLVDLISGREELQIAD